MNRRDFLWSTGVAVAGLTLSKPELVFADNATADGWRTFEVTTRAEVLKPAGTTKIWLFGSWEMNWMAYNFAQDVELPGSSGAPLAFLMYPQAQTTDGMVDSLDPDNFKYEITSKELS